MKKEFRVRKSKDFNTIIQKKHSVVNKNFVLYSMKNDDHLHVGISVSKKLGNAVIRNKTKRQVRMMVSHIFNKDECKSYIIIVRNQYLNHTYQENEESLLSLYKKVNKRS